MLFVMLVGQVIYVNKRDICLEKCENRIRLTILEVRVVCCDLEKFNESGENFKAKHLDEKIKEIMYFIGKYNKDEEK